MTRDYDPDPGFDPRIADWLEGAPDRAPGQILELVVAAIPSIPQRRAWRPSWRLAKKNRLAYLAALIVIAVATGIAGSRLLPTNEVGIMPIRPNPVPVDQMTVIRRQVDAINVGDTAAFSDTFAPGGAFNPGGDFQRMLFSRTLPIAKASYVEAWMAINDAWGFEAEIIACNQDPAAEIVFGYGDDGQGDPVVVTCDVATRWHNLSMEITERWTYEFHGSELGYWGFGLLDLNPPERVLPLGYDGLQAWETWLATTHPTSAIRYLNPRSSEAACEFCSTWQSSLASGDPGRAARVAPLLNTAQNRWSINGVEFAPGGLIPYDPALANEIEVSIQQYLDDR